MSDYRSVKTGVEIDDVTKFMYWARKTYPVADFGKYRDGRKEYILMYFRKDVDEGVFLRIMNGEFSPENISKEFGDANTHKRK